MASSFSTNSKLELIATGEKAGLWGTITNTNLQILEQLSSGYLSSSQLASGDLTLSFGRDDVNAAFSDGHNVPRINPARNIYSLSYEENDWLFKLSLKDVEKQDDLAEGETVTDSYQMLNARFTKTYNVGTGKLKLSVFGTNMLDEVARNHSSFVKNQVPLAARNYEAKFRYNF